MDLLALADVMKWVLGGMLTLGIWLVALGYRGGTLRGEFTAIITRLTAVEKRLDEGGVKISDLATAVQGLPYVLLKEFRVEFFQKEAGDAAIAHSEADRARLWDAISQMHEKR